MIGYRREIDGLRAVAVLPVIFFHAGFDAFSGGFVGVDVFFVISGYLITSIIVSEKAAGTFSLAGFYERRARRILPALFLVMAACLPLAWLWLLPGDMKRFAQSLAAVAAFASNILFWLQSGYFDTAAELKPLLHTWSLAVEEQYYLLFPLFILATWRRDRRLTIALLAILALLSLGLAQWGARIEPAATFYLLPTRGWELAIGALLAFYLLARPDGGLNLPARQAGSLAGLLLIGYAVFAFDKTTPFPSLYALAPTLGAALIILCATPATFVGRMLGSRLPLGVGLVSYSAYLWHQPLFAFARHQAGGKPGAALMLGLALLSFGCAYLSWRYVERPFRQKGRFSRKRIFAGAAVASLSFFMLGVVGQGTNGFEAYYLTHRLSPHDAEIYRLVRDHTGKELYDRMFDDGACRFWSRVIDEKAETRFRDCAGRHGKAVIVLGDSHAMNLYNIVAKAGISDFVVGVAQAGCRPGNMSSYCPYAGFDAFLARNRAAVDTVLFHQSGSYLLRDPAGRVDSPDAFAPDAPFRLAGDGVETIAAYLNGLSDRVPVQWLGPFVEARINVRDFRIVARQTRIPDKSLAQFALLEDALKTMAARENWRFRYVSLHDLMQVEASFLRVGDCIVYSDTDHFSACGEDLVAAKLRAAHAAGRFLD